MTKLFSWSGLRRSEWVLIAYFIYLASIVPFFTDRPYLHQQPLFFLVAVSSLLVLLAKLEQTRPSHVTSAVRDWLPILLTYVAFRETDFFMPFRLSTFYENRWVLQDRLLLDSWHLRAAIESFGKLLPLYLELCYLLVYGVAAYCVAVLYLQKRREAVDLFFVIYLAGTLSAYALFPYFPTLPPRIAFSGFDGPTFSSWLRQANLYILSKASIHVAVFPSAHVSSAFSAAWAMFLLFPKQKRIGWGLLIYAISVSIATIYGRYHYAADVLAGFIVSFVAAAVCLYIRNSRRALS